MITLKIISLCAALITVLWSLFVKFYRRRPIHVNYEDDERRIIVEHRQRLDAIKKEHPPITSPEEALQELNRKPGLD